jgi:hypothetical protein
MEEWSTDYADFHAFWLAIPISNGFFGRGVGFFRCQQLKPTEATKHAILGYGGVAWKKTV